MCRIGTRPNFRPCGRCKYIKSKLLYVLKQIMKMDARRILIVEDERKIADTLKFGLNEYGFHAEVAYDGKIGLTCSMRKIITS